MESRNQQNLLDLQEELASNPYPGRGIIVGKTADEKNAVCAYFIMGRSENSRNRIFIEDGSGLRTGAFDESKVSDPTLIIYNAVRVLGNRTIISNGDQTDTIYDGLKDGRTFEKSLENRAYEPDAPHYTPRISSMLKIENAVFNYKLSILKSDTGKGGQCLRYTFAYEDPVPGECRFIHTYMGDGNPLPTFTGEPKRLTLDGDLEELSKRIWESLNYENKVALFVRYIDIASGSWKTKIINKHS